ncbi:MAG: hypothetical protein HYS27_14010 [Deltaproteobacteria bacterium]|nr:hypothetical protein [Deltaproteobacteria bacterium]
MKRATLLVPAAILALAQAGCVTRTVYVVDDRDDAPIPATARATASAEPAPRYEDDAGISRVEDFYEPLSPYGRWAHTPLYGMVFIPSAAVVGAGFRPYTHGHWEQTEWGWTWVDHHPFGWATGHYGRWYFDSSYGWVWVPGTAWAPAWVSWRTGGGYVGWAPMPPGAVFGGAYTVYETSWVFVSYSGMGVGYVGSALIVGPAYRTCYASTSPYRDTYVVYGRTYYRGPHEDDVVHAGGHVVHRPIRDVDEERAVTRPPTGSGRAREDDDGRTRSRGERDDGRDDGSSRDGATGSPRDRDDGRGDRGEGDRGDHERGDHDRGHGNDPDHDDVDNTGRGEPGRDDGRGHGRTPGDDRGHGDDRGNAGDRGRGDDRGRPGSLVDDRGSLVDDVTPRLDPAAGAIGERGEVGVGVPAPDGTGVGRGERPPVGGERGGERTTPVRPGDTELRNPWRDDVRPSDRDQENPDKFHPITDPFGSRGPAVGAPPIDPRAGERGGLTPARPIEPRPEARGPVTPSRPSNLERTPRVDTGRPAVGAVRPTPQPDGQPTAEQPQPTKKDGKKVKATKKTDAKKK